MVLILTSSCAASALASSMPRSRSPLIATLELIGVSAGNDLLVRQWLPSPVDVAQFVEVQSDDLPVRARLLQFINLANNLGPIRQPQAPARLIPHWNHEPRSRFRPRGQGSLLTDWQFGGYGFYESDCLFSQI